VDEDGNIRQSEARKGFENAITQQFNGTQEVVADRLAQWKESVEEKDKEIHAKLNEWIARRRDRKMIKKDLAKRRVGGDDDDDDDDDDEAGMEYARLASIKGHHERRLKELESTLERDYELPRCVRESDNDPASFRLKLKKFMECFETKVHTARQRVLILEADHTDMILKRASKKNFAQLAVELGKKKERLSKLEARREKLQRDIPITLFDQNGRPRRHIAELCLAAHLTGVGKWLGAKEKEGKEEEGKEKGTKRRKLEGVEPEAKEKEEDSDEDEEEEEEEEDDKETEKDRAKLRAAKAAEKRQRRKMKKKKNSS
jgi:hypothetical protein